MDVLSHHAGTLIGAHLEVDAVAVHRLLHAHLGVIDVSSCSIGGHALLTGILIRAHLNMIKIFVNVFNMEMLLMWTAADVPR